MLCYVTQDSLLYEDIRHLPQILMLISLTLPTTSRPPVGISAWVRFRVWGDGQVPTNKKARLCDYIIYRFMVCRISSQQRREYTLLYDIKGPHRPDAIRQRDANFQFSKTNKTVNR